VLYLTKGASMLSKLMLEAQNEVLEDRFYRLLQTTGFEQSKLIGFEEAKAISNQILERPFDILPFCSVYLKGTKFQSTEGQKEILS
jgi:hypothetical protein